MPWAPLLLCVQPGCRARQALPRCPMHARVSSRNHYGTPRQRRGLGAAFDRWKPLVIERDGARCRLRHPGCTIVATTADHIIPRSQGGRTTLENLRASCCYCNSARGDSRNSEATRTSVTRAAGQTGRGIGSPAREAPARTAWQPRSRAAEIHRKISAAATAPLAGRPGSAREHA